MLYTTCLLTSLTPLRLARKKKWNVQEEKRIQQVPITISYFLPDLCMYICLSIKSPNSFLLFCLSFYLSLIYLAFISVLCSVCLWVVCLYIYIYIYIFSIVMSFCFSRKLRCKHTSTGTNCKLFKWHISFRLVFASFHDFFNFHILSVLDSVWEQVLR